MLLSYKQNRELNVLSNKYFLNTRRQQDVYNNNRIIPAFDTVRNKLLDTFTFN